MQRRPLSPIDYDPDIYRSPFERIMVFFNVATVSSHDILCATPLFFASNYGELFQMVGFVGCPLNPKEKRQILFPEQAPEGQHPTGFLQYGAKIQSHTRNQSHAFFEIGDHHYLVRFDFKEAFRECEDIPIYQLDELTISDGGVDYNLDCEDETHRSFIKMAMEITKSTVSYMHDNDVANAMACFGEFKELAQILCDTSNQMMADHTAAEIRAKQVERGLGKKTP
jgi:hypothetical protein